MGDNKALGTFLSFDGVLLRSGRLGVVLFASGLG